MGKEPTGRFNTLYTAVKFTAGTNLAGWFNGGAGIFIQKFRASYNQNILYAITTSHKCKAHFAIFLPGNVKPGAITISIPASFQAFNIFSFRSSASFIPNHRSPVK